MVEFQLNPTSLSKLKTVFQLIEGIMNPVNLEFSADRLRLQASGNGALVELLLPSNWFQQYNCDDDLMVCINPTQISEMLKCWGSDENTTVRVDGGNNTILFTCTSTAQDGVSHFDFEINTLDTPIEPIDFADREYRAIVTMPSHIFAKICRNFVVMDSNDVEISVCEEVEAKGNIKRATFVTNGFMARGTVICKDTLDGNIDIAMDGEIKLSFLLEVMNMFAKEYKLSNTVSIGLIDDAHNKGGMLEYMLGDGHLRFYLGSLF